MKIPVKNLTFNLVKKSKSEYHINLKALPKLDLTMLIKLHVLFCKFS